MNIVYCLDTKNQWIGNFNRQKILFVIFEYTLRMSFCYNPKTLLTSLTWDLLTGISLFSLSSIINL